MDFSRDFCIHDPVLVGLLALSNAAIAISYVFIPWSIVRVAISLRRVPQAPLWGLFVGFILSCGFTHAAAVLVLFRPAFNLETFVCLGAAMASITTAIVLHRSVPNLRRLFRAFEDLDRTLGR